MTPADAPNASDGPLAATKPPEKLAAESIGNGRALAVSRHRHSANPARIPLWLLAPHSLARLGSLEAPVHHRRSHAIPIAGTTVPRFSPIRF